MKRIGTKNIIRKATAVIVLALVLAGAIMTIFTTAAGEDGIPTLDSTSGTFNFGTVGISDPVKVTTDGGYYMNPSSYVYLGDVYNAATKTYEPVICRVLDSDSDNLGNGGAMLLYTESALEPSRFYRGAEGMLASIGTENIYANSYLSSAGSEKYFLKSLYGMHFADVPEVEDFIRRVTKSDYKADMQGLYSDFLESIDVSKYPEISQYTDRYIFSFETDTRDEATAPYYAALPTDSVLSLNNAALFPLSADEFNKYMGSSSSSDNYASKYMLFGNGVSYWLRTGIYEKVDIASREDNITSLETNMLGNLVLGVDASGNLTAIAAEDSDVYGRFAFNLETENISYNSIINGVHKLAFSDSRYAVGEEPFKAEIVNTDGSVVTLKYTNAIRSRSTVWYGDNEKEYVSVMIKDADGNIKSYASIAEVPQCYYESDEEKKSSEYFTASFRLPDDYDEENDTILVFWERKDDDERKPSFTSNMVSIDCAHTYYRTDGTFDKLPSCTQLGSCAICGEEFGEFDLTSHPNMESGEYAYDDEKNVHWHLCPDCGAPGESTECKFIEYCIQPCACGNIDENSEYHNFNYDGICTRDSSHYEKPEIKSYGQSISIWVENIGNWLWIAEQLASGWHYYMLDENYHVYVVNDLDFDGVDFIPLGTPERPFTGTVDSLGTNSVISNISYSDADADGVGVVAVAENAKITNISLQNVSFAGKSSVGALVGKATNVDVEGVTVLEKISLSADGGAVGAFFGSADPASSVFLSFSYPTDGYSPIYLPASGSGAPSVDTAFFLAPLDGEGGSISESTFASGMVAYSFNAKRPGLGWRQTLFGDGKDPYPRRDGIGEYVRITEYCDGTPAVYTNNSRDEMIHHPVEVYGHEWKFSHSYCDLEALCDKCGQIITTPADVEIIYDYPKTTHIASIVINGVSHEIDRVVIFGVTLEEFIGMESITVTYDGKEILSDVLMTNTALHSSEYVAYFVNSETGEKYMYENYYGEVRPISIYDVGVYDLVVVGKQGTAWTEVGGNWTEDNTVTRGPRNFSGQSVTYEKVLTVLPAEVTVTPHNVFKYYDGNGEFVPSWSVDSDSFYPGEFNVYYSASSSEVGDYTLKVTADTGYHGDNVKLILSTDSVIGSIIEIRNVNIENSSYPGTFGYGDEITTPTKDHFKMTDGAEFSYEWFENKRTNESKSDLLVPISGKPENAGRYVLRAYASSNGTLGASYTDVDVEIVPVRVEVSYEFDSNVKTFEYNETIYYMLDSLDEIKVKLDGFINGDTADSLGITAKAVIYGERSTLWMYPSRKNVYISYEIAGNADNYYFVTKEDASEFIVSLSGAGLPEIVEEEYSYDYDWTTGDYNWGFRYEFTWEPPVVDGFELDHEVGEHWYYNLSVYDISYGIENKLNTDIRYVGIGGSDRTYENYYAVRTDREGVYLIELEVTARNGLRNDIEIPGVENSTLYIRYIVDIRIDIGGEMVEAIDGPGTYTVTVNSYSSTESYESGVPEKTTSYDFTLAKEVQMNFKEIEYNLSDGSFNFDLKDIYKHVVMTAGGVFNLNHELVDVYISVNIYSGFAYVTGFKVVDQYGNDVSHLYKAAGVLSGSLDHTGGGVGTAHIFDSPCDTDCNIASCEYTRNVGHHGDAFGDGNCSTRYICEACGGAYMPEHPEHLTDKTVIVRCGDDMSVHELMYTCCGEIAYREGHYSAEGATCKTLATCDGCGRGYGEFDPNNHENEASYVTVDDNEHSVNYSCCGMSYNEDHSGGSATCTTLAACEYCGASYGEVDKNNHTGTVEVKIDTEDPDMHIKFYNCCEESVKEAHSGGSATCLLKAECEACKASYGVTDPDNHASDSVYYELREDNVSMHDAYHSCCNEYIGKFYHTGGSGSCNSGPVCESCGAEYGEHDPSVHASGEYIYVPDELDSTRHVKLHACCELEVERAEHSFGEADCIGGATCKYCGMKDGKTAEHVYSNDCDAVCDVCERTTRPETFHVDKNGDEKCDSCEEHLPGEGISAVAVSGIVTGATVVAGAGGFSLFWFVIKKKKFTDLIAFFK